MFNWIKNKFKKEDKEKLEKDKVKPEVEETSEVAEVVEVPEVQCTPEVEVVEVPEEVKIEEKIEAVEVQKEIVETKVEQKVESKVEPKTEVEKVIEKEEVKEKIEEPKFTSENNEKKLVKEVKTKEVEDKTPDEKGMFKRLFNGLNKTRKNLVYQINSVFSSNEIDDDFYDELEEVLVMSDIGAKTTMTIIDELRDRLVDRNIHDSTAAKEILKEVMLDVLNENIDSNDLNLLPLPSIVMLVGVNGVGKTTTVGKLAYQFKQEGMSVAIIAADTFRAAAIDQLEVWGERAGVKIISQKEGADPASVVFDGLDYSLKNNIDITIIDTAGRLHNKVNLMNELNKIRRIIDKKMPNATMEVIMALDATTGQNAILQLNEFKEAANVTGVALTKLDGTAKGGVIIPIQHEEGIPVKIIGVGESIYDLQPFDPKLFVDAIFEEK